MPDIRDLRNGHDGGDTRHPGDVRGVREAAVVVIGAGPGGLGVAGALKRRGIHAVVLEQADHLAPAWRGAYERLRLNTTRSRSRLPGHPMPRRFGRWPTGEDFVAYLDQYATQHELDVRLGVHVASIEPTDGLWSIRTSTGTWRAPQISVATGLNATPASPSWAADDRFIGTILHSSQYRTGAAFTGKRVVVVGAGNSGADIAVDLLDHRADVAVAVRTPPHIVPRQRLGIPADLVGVALHRLPAPLGDHVIALAHRATCRGLCRRELPVPSEGAISRHRRDGVEPVIDNGLVTAIRRRRLTLLAAVRALTATGVLLADGSTHDADVVITATGYRSNLAQIADHPDLLDHHGRPVIHGPTVHPRHPGLRFLGYTSPISGNLRELRHEARRIARAVDRDIAHASASDEPAKSARP